MFFKKNSAQLGKALEEFRTDFTKPQWHHFQTYICGLILGGKNEKNVMDIANNSLDGRSQSSLNRFLHSKSWSVRQVENRRLNLAMRGKSGGVLSLDDTIIEKFGQHMEGAGWLYDHTSGKKVWCHNFVSTFYSNGEDSIPLSFEAYVKSDATDGHFKTKLQLARELLEKALVYVDPEAVTFDSWFGAKELFDFLTARGQTWVTEAKINRLIQWEDEWQQVKEVFKQIPKDEYKRIDSEVEGTRFKWHKELEVTMKNVGKVKLVFLRKRKNSKTFTALITNNTDLSTSQIIQYYKKRWDIEVFYRDCKQHLGMGECQIRKLDAVVIHLHLVFLAYTLLKGIACNSALFSHILKGTKAIGTICQRLKHWTLKQLIKSPKSHLA